MTKKKTKNSIRTRLIRYLREWHRRLGIFAAFFLIFLSLTGIALNHTTLFSLSHQSISTPWLLSHYGIKPAVDVRFYQQKNWLVTDQLVWLKDKLVFESDETVVSLAKFQSYTLLATRSQLILLTENGEIVDKLDSSTGLPVAISALSVTDNHIVLKAADGYYQSDSDFIDWKKVQTLIKPSWIANEPVTQAELAVAQRQFQSQFLNWERVILDAHSGRLFGDVGVLFMDMVAFFLILLSISGIYIWLRYTKSKR
jgi:hypothetical protein